MPDQKDEASFRRWYADAAKRFDLNPDPDAPDQFYDYRAAFKAGAWPDKTGHWPSDFKRSGHPNEIVGGFNTRTGERVPGTPRAKDAAALVSLGWDADTAKRLAAMPEPASTPQTLAQKWRAKYGSAYDDLSDIDLEAKIDAKYPGAYDDVPRTAKEPPPNVRPGTMVQIPDASLTPAGRREQYLHHMDPMSENNKRIGELADAHPIITTGLLMAAAGGPGLARSIASGVAAKGAPLAARVAPVVGEAIAAASPAIKYELAKTALTSVGVPNSIAVPAAVIVSGLKRPSKAAPVEPTASAAPKPTAAAAPVEEPSITRLNQMVDAAKAQPVTVRMVKPAAAAEPAAAPSEPTPKPVAVAPTEAPIAPKSSLTPPQIASQLDTVARKANFNMTPTQHQAAFKLVRDGGLSPTQAVLKIKAATRDVNAAAALLKIPGFMTEEQMNAEIAARRGNRSPTR